MEGYQGSPRGRSAIAIPKHGAGRPRQDAQRPGEMRDGCVAGHDQVEIGHKRRRIDEGVWTAVEGLAEVREALGKRRRDVRKVVALLQADQTRRSEASERQQGPGWIERRGSTRKSTFPRQTIPIFGRIFGSIFGPGPSRRSRQSVTRSDSAAR